MSLFHVKQSLKALLEQRKGFTLIEVIVVLIIVGVLAALAFVNIFSSIEKSRSAEVIPVLKMMADRMDGCYYKNGTNSFAGCAAISNTTTHFTVSSTIPFPTMYEIIASRNTVDNLAAQQVFNYDCLNLGGMPSTVNAYGGAIVLCYDAATGSRNLVSLGYYQGI